MKKIFLALVVLISGIGIAQAQPIPYKYQGEWRMILISKDHGKSFTQASTSIGLMEADRMMSRGTPQIFGNWIYDEQHEIFTIVFRDSPTVWIVSSMRARYLVEVYHIENGKSEYRFTMMIEIEK